MPENKRTLELEKLYGKENLEENEKRYEHLTKQFIHHFGDGCIDYFSSPGRTEILGNHTDHNNGKVLTGSIHLDTIAAAGKNGTNKIHLISETYAQDITLDLNCLEKGKSHAGTEELLKGICAGFLKKGYAVEGFDAYISTDVIGAAGISSSASFEMLLCCIINYFFNHNAADCVEYAKIGQYAENEYWNKHSGLLDQMACAMGGVTYIDFKDSSQPSVQKLDFDYGDMGCDLVIVNTGKSHADLSEEYSSIPLEMKSIAAYFGRDTLSEVEEAAFYDNIGKLRAQVSDRAILRATHFFEEQDRVTSAVTALSTKDYDAFLNTLKASGHSSWMYLQNCYIANSPEEQSIPIALSLTNRFLNRIGAGCCRIHGGGFAGVIMCVLPKEHTGEYLAYMAPCMGEENLYVMQLRKSGAIHLI